MKITALVENMSTCELKAKHGLSLLIETDRHKILFDLGPDGTLFENAAKRNNRSLLGRKYWFTRLWRFFALPT